MKDEDVEFDHIIPWSKGGSSDEHNIRLLHKDCNRKKGKKFKDEYLVGSIQEHLVEPVGIEVVGVLIELVKVRHKLCKEEERYPTALDICGFWGRQKVRDTDEMTVRVIKDIDEFFNLDKPREIKQKVFKALGYRWGFADGEVHKLKEASRKFGIEIGEFLLAELSLINRLGWQVKLAETTKKEWLRL